MPRCPCIERKKEGLREERLRERKREAFRVLQMSGFIEREKDKEKDVLEVG